MIRRKQWGQRDMDFMDSDAHIDVGWGICKKDIGGLQKKIPVCQSSIPNFWSPLQSVSLKLNFNAKSRGNPRAIGYGGVCRDATGGIMKIHYGSTGDDTKNYVEL